MTLDVTTRARGDNDIARLSTTATGDIESCGEVGVRRAVLKRVALDTYTMSRRGICRTHRVHPLLLFLLKKNGKNLLPLDIEGRWACANVRFLEATA